MIRGDLISGTGTPAGRIIFPGLGTLEFEVSADILTVNGLFVRLEPEVSLILRAYGIIPLESLAEEWVLDFWDRLDRE